MKGFWPSGRRRGWSFGNSFSWPNYAPRSEYKTNVPPTGFQVLEVHSSACILNPDERGLVISNPLSIENDSSLFIENSELDENEIRASLLFWDRLEWPDNTLIKIGDDERTRYLEDLGILTRSQVVLGNGGSMAEAIRLAHSSVFEHLERQSPGQWAIGRGVNSLSVFDDNKKVNGRSMLVDLHQAIPVPSGQTPFEEILEFKFKRKPELLALRNELEALALQIISSPDQPLSELRAFQKIDNATNNLRVVSNEAKFTKILGSVRSSISLDNIVDKAVEPAFVAGALGAAIFTHEWAIGVGAGITTSIIKDAYKAIRRPNGVIGTPYEYVYRFNHDIKWIT